MSYSIEHRPNYKENFRKWPIGEQVLENVGIELQQLFPGELTFITQQIYHFPGERPDTAIVDALMDNTEAIECDGPKTHPDPAADAWRDYLLAKHHFLHVHRFTQDMIVKRTARFKQHLLSLHLLIRKEAA